MYPLTANFQTPWRRHHSSTIRRDISDCSFSVFIDLRPSKLREGEVMEGWSGRDRFNFSSNKSLYPTGPLLTIQENYCATAHIHSSQAIMELSLLIPKPKVNFLSKVPHHQRISVWPLHTSFNKWSFYWLGTVTLSATWTITKPLHHAPKYFIFVFTAFLFLYKYFISLCFSRC